MDADKHYPMRDTVIDALEEGSTTTSETTQRQFVDARIVKAFNSILERDIETTGSPAGTPDRRALPIAGDDTGAKTVVAGVLDTLGFDVVDAGPLKEGWRFERARPAYCRRLTVPELQRALQEADTKLVEGSWRASQDS